MGRRSFGSLALSIVALGLIAIVGGCDEPSNAAPTPSAASKASTPKSAPALLSNPKTLIVTLPGGVPMEFIRIPAGTFMMGSEKDPLGEDKGWRTLEEELPRHEVKIAHDFYLAKYEVTQDQWVAVMGKNPSSESSLGGKNPVNQVSWNDCKEFTTAMEKLGQGIFRLPSEAEWEYACRAGSTTRFYFGDSDGQASGGGPCQLDEYAWYSGNAEGKLHPVGEKRPNAFELYDMVGNVWEWCEDAYEGSYEGAPTDGSARPRSGRSSRVLRGGSWRSGPAGLRSAYRNRNLPELRNFSIGFRPALTP